MLSPISTPSLGVLLDYYDAIESSLIRDASWGGDGNRLAIAGDLVIRPEWRRVHTTQPTLTGDVVISQVMASHSTHLQSVQDMAAAAFLTRRLQTRTRSDRCE